MKRRKCVSCGLGVVQSVAVAGRTTKFKGIEVEVPATLAIRTCDNCGEEFIHASEAKAHDLALEKVYRSTIRSRLVAALVALEPIGSMSRIEAVLGLSKGYLSKLKQKRAEASPILVSSLALIATAPNSLETLEAMWKSRPTVKRPSATRARMGSQRSRRSSSV
jgi:hypothetical protein